jgi:hypothetical protein
MKSKNKSTQTKTIIIFGLTLLIIIPIILNFLLLLFNWLFHKFNFNFSAFGLGNSEWLAFWGSYLGGIATLFAVFLTVKQAENHYLQMKIEQEKQRRLDVLPLILLQPRLTRQTSPLTTALGDIEKKSNGERLYVDELKPFFEEYDISEITVLFGSQFEVRSFGLSDEEFTLVLNNGHEEEISGKTKFLYLRNLSFLRPYWSINVGKERANNIKIGLYSSANSEICNLNTVFSLKAKDQIKLNFFVNIKIEERARVYNDYFLVIRYDDIFLNNYEQTFPISIKEEGDKYKFVIDLKIDQKINEG